MFQHAAARRRLDSRIVDELVKGVVSTRSRPKAAGLGDKTSTWTRFVSTRSRPKAAGHTHLERKAVGMFQHAAARRRLVRVMWGIHRLSMFQHAAARRRLGIAKCRIRKNSNCFNTQPPEGGWEWIKEARKHIGLFQHAAARRRLDLSKEQADPVTAFQHAAARRRLAPHPAI